MTRISAREPNRSELLDATLTTSRALLGVVARSVAQVLEDVTLPQFRVLVVLHSSGPMRTGALAERLGANVSTFSRSLDRIVENGWVDRRPSPESRREILVELSPSGAEIVDQVTSRRREQLARILDDVPTDDRASVARGFAAFARAAGEPSVDDLLTLGL